MAQLIFSSLGQTAGSALLPNGVSILGQQVSGAAIGQFAGSLAGAAIDAYLLAPRLEGPRVKDVHVTESREGAHIPKIYGRMRVGGNVIWAARFKEKTQKEGGKGGPSQTTYSYSLSFAVGLCEGEVSRISRIWANGEEMDISKVNWRLHKGSLDQEPDALIEAVEGNAPAYRGLAYIVFEDLPLDDYGMRMPQLSFEVMRSAARPSDEIPRMESAITSINLIPGSGEFAYATDVVRRIIDDGEETPENMHNGFGKANFVTSIDQALDELPSLKHVNLIVGWFGNDLRCADCLIRPGVEMSEKLNFPRQWEVAGQSRGNAYLISQTEGRANYGGTPEDVSVIQAIKALKARGIDVTLYPFLFMDVPYGNGLTDPYGKSEQAAFPWRGRITCTPSIDATQPAAVEVETFFGQASADQFQDGQYIGPEDWHYRRFILHYANLARQAGGVHGFLIGAEMVSLSRIRSARGVYPAASEFADLAHEAKILLNTDCKVSYAADWTEYGAYVPDDGFNDTDFPLDELWASNAIDFIGVDWYPPMADWRAILGHVDEIAGWKAIYDTRYLAANIEGGEGYDWYYESADHRASQNRTPITDGSYGEDWTYRQKDIRNWHAHLHFPRRGGVKLDQPTRWVAGAKPIRFVEFGCSAVDMGPNQPNVFYDPKSSENSLPHYSSGMRDDVVQRKAIEAFCDYWKGDELLDEHGISVWAWDARPFPAWPSKSDIWSDGDNWNYGHWLNGRVGLALLQDVVSDLTGDLECSLNTDSINGLVTGYVVDTSMSIRDSLEPLKRAFDIRVVEDTHGLIFENGLQSINLIEKADFEIEDGRFVRNRSSMERKSTDIRVRYIDSSNDYLPGVALSFSSPNGDYQDVGIPLVLDEGSARHIARDLQSNVLLSQDTATVSTSLQFADLDAGDIISFNGKGESWRIEKLQSGNQQTFSLMRHAQRSPEILAGILPSNEKLAPFSVRPSVIIVDGPPLPDQPDDARPYVFASSNPWIGDVYFSVGADKSLMSQRAVVTKPSTIGRLISPLEKGVSNRWMNQSFEVKLINGQLDSVSDLAVLNGGNAAFIETENGWELIQFQFAELIGLRQYKVSRLLRGQQGGDSLLGDRIEANARVIFLNEEQVRLNLKKSEQELDLVWTAKSSGPAYDIDIWGEICWKQHGLTPWSPVHLKAEKNNVGIVISWIERSRVNGDQWAYEGGQSTDHLNFEISILSGNEIVRQWSAQGRTVFYPIEQMIVDFPSQGQAIIEVREVSKSGLIGHAARSSILI